MFFLEFHPDHFVVKEQTTRKPILRGQCEGGLYPIKSSSSGSVKNKEALGVFKPPTSVWHHRLGHAATPIVQQILSRHKLSFVKDLDDKHVCDACQQGKSHQLPYPRSSSVSSRPLDLVFLDVWGPAPASVGFIFCSISPRCLDVSLIFKILLNVNSIAKFMLCKQIGVGNTDP
jgi:histone deacetylase 1/2